MATQATDQITIPDNMAFAGWDFDIEVIEELVKNLEIEQPIRIRYTAGRNVVGCRKAKKDKNGVWIHSITISQYRDMEDSMNTLIHELTHCHQAEKWARETGNDWFRFGRMEYSRYGRSGNRYYHNPYEIQARKFGEDLQEAYPVLY